MKKRSFSLKLINILKENLQAQPFFTAIADCVLGTYVIVNFLNIGTDWSEKKTVHTQIRPLPKEEYDQGLHWLCESNVFHFQDNYSNSF